MVLAAAASAADDSNSNKKCTNLRVPVHVQAENSMIDYTPEDSEISTTNFFLNFAQAGANLPKELMTGVRFHPYLLQPSKSCNQQLTNAKTGEEHD